MELNVNKQPFAAVPDIEAWFPSETMEESDRGVFQCLDRGEGVSLVFGESGVGKTLLLNRLAEKFSPDDLVIISASRIRDAKSFLQQMLYSVHQTWCGCTENELRLMFRDYIEKSRYARIILLLDDAQFFKYSIYEDLRSLLDIHRDGLAYVRIALAGTATLEERLTHPKLASFQQRVVSRYWLEPFNYAETKDYLFKELNRFVSDSKLYELSFAKEAVKFIYNKTEGIPRLINHLGRASINVLLHELEQKNSFDLEITERLVQKAWSIIQQIPEASQIPNVQENHPASDFDAGFCVECNNESSQKTENLTDSDLQKSEFSEKSSENTDSQNDLTENTADDLEKSSLSTFAKCQKDSFAKDTVEFGLLKDDYAVENTVNNTFDLKSAPNEKNNFSEKELSDAFMPGGSNKEKSKLSDNKEGGFSNDSFSATAENSLTRSDEIIEFGTLEPEEAVSPKSVNSSDSEDQRKSERSSLSREIGASLKSADAMEEESGVWEIQLSPHIQGAVLSKHENKDQARSSQELKTEKTPLDKKASVLPVDDEVAKRVKFIPSDYGSDISFNQGGKEALLERNEFSFHRGHDLNDLIIPGTLNQVSGRLNRINDLDDSSRSDLFQDLTDKDLQIEKAHSIAFEQERLDEEKRQEDRHETRISSVFKQIYDQKK